MIRCQIGVIRCQIGPEKAVTQKYDRYAINCFNLRRWQEFNDVNSWPLTIVDSFAKPVWSYKLNSKTANELAKALHKSFCYFGTPVSSRADNGKEFSNQTLKLIFFDEYKHHSWKTKKSKISRNG